MSGNIYVIAGPSGVGKGTVLKKVLKLDKNLALSISATTRKPREGEVDGVNYYFVTRERFDEIIAEDGFLEYAEYVGNRYGTPLQPVLQKAEEGYDVILEIEVQGCMQVMEKLPNAKGIFILPPSMKELESRLRGRESETDEVIKKRLETAKVELGYVNKFDYFVVNDTVQNAANRIIRIIESNR
ncbi:MAG: guanylate kinase [Clostridia bacterium]|nr:guanylate kinase [Clostridia bacterium]